MNDRKNVSLNMCSDILIVCLSCWTKNTEREVPCLFNSSPNLLA